MIRTWKPLELNVIFGSGLPQPGASQITKDAAVAGRLAPASAIAIIHSAEIGRSEYFGMVFLPLIGCCSMSLGVRTTEEYTAQQSTANVIYLAARSPISGRYRSFRWQVGTRYCFS